MKCKTSLSNQVLPEVGLPEVSEDMRCSLTKYHNNLGRYVEYTENGLGEQNSFEYHTAFEEELVLIEKIRQTDDNGNCLL